MSRKFEQTTQQLLDLDPSAAHDLSRFMAWRMIRSSFIVRIGVLTVLLSVFLMLNIRPYQLGDVVIVLCGGYALAANIMFVTNSLKRVGLIRA